MPHKNNILFVLNGHKYVSYFFEPLAHYAKTKGFQIGLALPKNGKLKLENWPSSVEHVRFSANENTKNPFKFLIKAIQPAFINSNVNILHLVTTQMVLFTLLRLNLRIEKIQGIVIFHFIGLGRVLGGTGFISFLVRKFFKFLWITRCRREIKYLCIYLNDDDFKVLFSLFGKNGIIYRKIPGAGVRKERFSYQFVPKKSPLKLLYVGRLIEEKGLETFIKLVRKLNDESKISVLGQIVGGFESIQYQKKIQKMIGESDNLKNFEFYGEVSDPGPYYARANFFIFPTNYGEGVPTVLLEAQYCGTPCLASSIAGCKEAVKDGETGLIVEGFKIETWLECFLDLTKSSNYKAMCENAHRHIDANFDAMDLAKKTIDWLVYETETKKEPANC